MKRTIPAHQLTGLRGDNASPRWSPDGRQIAFVSQRGDHSFVAVYDLGHESVRYLSPSADRDGMPRWSPDGRHIAFIRRPGIQGKLPLIPMPSCSMGDLAGRLGNRRRGKKSGTAEKRLPIHFPEETADKSFYFAGNDKLLVRLRAGWQGIICTR